MPPSVFTVSLIPGTRASHRTTPEVRAFTEHLRSNQGSLEISLISQGNPTSVQSVPIQNQKEISFPLDLTDCLGELQIRFRLQEQGRVLEEIQVPYEVIGSDCRSTRLLDGAFVDIVHWSESEAQKYNADLKTATDEDWIQQIEAMHRIGLNTVVVQNLFHCNAYVNQHGMTVETYEGKGFYPSRLFPDRVPIQAQDPIESILITADRLKMNVFLGVGNFAWFDFTPQSLKWHLAVTEEVHERYGHHPSLYGWYVSEEIMGDFLNHPDFYYDGHIEEFIEFFASYREYIRKLTPCKPILFAPNNFEFEKHLEQWRKALAHIDIIAPFGFARNPVKNIHQMLALCREVGTHMWVDMELFKFPFPEGLEPKPLEAILKEMEDYADVEFIIGYAFTGILDSPDSRLKLGGRNPAILYQHYQEYYDTIRRCRFDFSSLPESAIYQSAMTQLT